MKRVLLLLLVSLLLTGCKAWVSRWAPVPTGFPTPPIQLYATPLPSPTFDPRLCILVEDFRPLPDLSADLLDLYDQQGFRDIDLWAEAYGQICLDENKQSRDFFPRQTNIRLGMSIASLEDPQAVGIQLREVLGVLTSVPQEELPGADIGTLSVTFFAAGQQALYIFPLDLGRRAYDQGLTGEDLLAVLR